MASKVYSIYDAKTEAFMSPFLMVTKGQAIRAFTDLVNDPNSQVSKHPEDYTLYELGEFDDRSGLYKNHDVKQDCGHALTLRNPPQTSEIRKIGSV